MLATSIVGPGSACHMLSVFHFGFDSQLEEIKTGIANAKGFSVLGRLSDNEPACLVPFYFLDAAYAGSPLVA